MWVDNRYISNVREITPKIIQIRMFGYTTTLFFAFFFQMGDICQVVRPNTLTIKTVVKQCPFCKSDFFLTMKEEIFSFLSTDLFQKEHVSIVSNPISISGLVSMVLLYMVFV